MPKKTIAIMSECAKTDNFSKTSIVWLNYLSNDMNIKHALKRGERVLTIGNKTYTVDGYCEETKTVYEFCGYFWHGCPNCYKPNIINNKNHERDMSTLIRVTNTSQHMNANLLKAKISKNLRKIRSGSC